MVNWKGSGCGLILMHLPRIGLEGLRKITKTLFRIAGLGTEAYA
jgi:hypothetical protein